MLKIIIFTAFLMMNNTLLGLDPSWLPRTLEKIEDASKQPKERMFEELARYLGMKQEAELQQWPMGVEQSQVYEKVFNLFATTPGHAEHYAKKLMDARGIPSQPLPFGYDQVYKDVSEMLSRLPTPETIQVLGRLLEDDIDYVDSGLTRKEVADRLNEQIRDMIQLEKENKPTPQYPTSGPSVLAVNVLRKLSVRGLPTFDMSYKIKNSAYHTACREWWQKVESGQQAFSFPGQLVEYRFKTDGTVESTPLPASVLGQDPKPPAMRMASSKEQFPQQSVAVATDESLDSNKWNWLWVIGGILAALAGVAWLRPKLSGSN